MDEHNELPSVEHQLMDMSMQAYQPDLLQDTFEKLSDAFGEGKDKGIRDAFRGVALDLEEQSHSSIAPRNILIGYITLSNLLEEYRHGQSAATQNLANALGVFDNLKTGEPVIGNRLVSGFSNHPPSGIMTENAAMIVVRRGSIVSENPLEGPLPNIRAGVIMSMRPMRKRGLAKVPEVLSIPALDLNEHCMIAGRTAVAAFFDEMQFDNSHIEGDSITTAQHARRLANIFNKQGIPVRQP